MDLLFYNGLLAEIRARVQTAQISATLRVNAEMLLMYWDIGQMISQRQQQEGWSASVIPRLVNDLKNEFPALKGFSERNLGYMLSFYKTYPNLQQAVAKLDTPNPITFAFLVLLAYLCFIKLPPRATIM